MRAPVVARLRLHMYEPLRMKRRRLLVQRRTIIIMFTVKKPCKPVVTSGLTHSSGARRARIGAEIGLDLNKARTLTQVHAYINARVYARSRARVDAQAPARNGPGARPGGGGSLSRARVMPSIGPCPIVYIYLRNAKQPRSQWA